MKSIPPALLALTVLTLAGPAMGADEATVGTFVQRLALAKNLDATEPRVAVDSLLGAGIQVPADLDLSARLTEGEVARLARAIGLDVSTNRPDDPFSDHQIERFFESTRVELALDSPPQPGDAGKSLDRPRFDPSSRSKSGRKGKKKGRRSTPTEPE